MSDMRALSGSPHLALVVCSPMQRCFASARRGPRSLLDAAYCRLQPPPPPQPKPVCHRPRTLGGEPGDSRGGGDYWSAQIAEGSKTQDDQAWPWSTYATDRSRLLLIEPSRRMLKQDFRIDDLASLDSRFYRFSLNKYSQCHRPIPHAMRCEASCLPKKTGKKNKL